MAGDEKPPPVFRLRQWAALFADPFIANTELEGGMQLNSLSVLHFFLGKLVEDERAARAAGASSGSEGAAAAAAGEEGGGGGGETPVSLLPLFDDAGLKSLAVVCRLLEACLEVCKRGRKVEKPGQLVELIGQWLGLLKWVSSLSSSRFLLFASFFLSFFLCSDN